MKDKDKVVNSEEQNRAVNPGGDSENQETASQDQPINREKNNPAETEKPDRGSEVENPRRTGDEDADSTEKKIPDM